MEIFSFLVVQKVKTSVQKKNPNPVWNEVLQLSVTNPTKPVHLVSLLFQLVQHFCSPETIHIIKIYNLNAMAVSNRPFNFLN
jgi:hypothetical protein